MTTTDPMLSTRIPGPAADELWRWSATEMADAVATGTVSRCEVVQSCLGRIREDNPQLNALIEVRPYEALAMADEAGLRRSVGDELGPLHGVPVSIRGNSDQAGYATTQGVLAFQDAMANVDSPHGASLRRAGAVLMGRSNSPAFAYRWFTNNALHGRTSTRGTPPVLGAALAAGRVPPSPQEWCQSPEERHRRVD